MNITGIIAEYNPFHNGHAYQLKHAKAETNADYIIIVMSGNFMQRGVPALLDKYTRAEMALKQGADLVLELPAIWSSASAEYFANAGVSLLTQLGCVDTLCYGCETPDSDLFIKISALLCDEPPKYQQLLTSHLKQGANYALAREKALLQIMPDAQAADIQDILQNPNNILALEYQKAIAKETTMKAYPILRQGAGYHSKSLTNPTASAAAIRILLAQYADDLHSDTFKTALNKLRQIIPVDALNLLLDYLHAYPFLYEDDCSQMLHYCLIKGTCAGFDDYADCTMDFSNKIRRNIDNYTGFMDFCTLLKTKDMTYTRICRSLLHILLNIRKSDYIYWSRHHYMPYARVLGFRKSSDILFTHLKKHSTLPLLTRAADAKKLLNTEVESAFFQNNIFADSIYRALVAEKGGRAMPNEYQQKIRIV